MSFKIPTFSQFQSDILSSPCLKKITRIKQKCPKKNFGFTRLGGGSLPDDVMVGENDEKKK